MQQQQQEGSRRRATLVLDMQGTLMSGDSPADEIGAGGWQRCLTPCSATPSNTYPRWWVMGRNHVHYATGLPDSSVFSGIRCTSEVVIFLNVEKALKDNMKLFISDNHVVLKEGFDGVVPCDYFEKIVEWLSNRLHF
ncbi:hypothetical protein L7F22_003931 [Adiantum nelumboides]|nr:hypothetical protein [Adiantum nelumboides]